MEPTSFQRPFIVLTLCLGAFGLGRASVGATAIEHGVHSSVEATPSLAGWVVLLGEPSGLEPDGVTPSILGIGTERASFSYTIPADQTLHDLTRTVVDALVDRGIAASMVTDGVIQFTLSGALDRGLSVELTDTGLDVSHWVETR